MEMPPTKPGMTIQQLQELMTVNEVENANKLALKLGLARSTTARWLKGTTVIDRRAAALIREKLRKRS